MGRKFYSSLNSKELAGRLANQKRKALEKGIVEFVSRADEEEEEEEAKSSKRLDLNKNSTGKQ